MPLITVLHDPSGINKTDKIAVKPGTALRDWLIEEYGPDGFDVPTRIFRHPVCIENEIDLTINFDDPIILGNDDVIAIVHAPTDPVDILIAVVIAVIASVILAPDPVPIPRTPEQETGGQSPNNRIGGQTNIARPLERIPDLYGKNKVWPDLIAKTYFEYVSNVQYVTEYLCVGRGDFLLEELRSGETLIDDIEGATATVFEANTDPAELLDVLASQQVNGQELAGPNDIEILNLTDLLVDSYIGGVMQTTDANMAAFDSLSFGETFTISNSTLNNGLFTFVSYIYLGPDPGLGLEATYIVQVSETFTSDSNDTIDVLGSAGASGIVGPFVVPNGAVDSIWIDILAPQGLQIRETNLRNSVSVSFDVDIQEIDSLGAAVGAVDTQVVTIQDNTINDLAFTFKLIPNALTTGVGYEVTITRTSNTNNSTSVQIYDLTKWSRLAGVVELLLPDFGNVTKVLIVTKATAQATSLSERDFNVLATRKLRTYDLVTEAILPTLTATKRFADAMLEHLTDPFLGNKALAEIDLDGLYTIQDALDNDTIYPDGTLGRFCYSLSDQRVSVGDELQTIANATRCYVARQGNIVIFGRDDEKPNRTTLFNGRNKKPSSESKSYKFNKPSDFDGVELQWTPEDSSDASIVTFPELPDTTINPLKITGAGIKNFEQAWNRAYFEFLKIQYIRQTVQTTVTREGLFLLLKDRVGNIDGTNVAAQGGEIKAVAADGITIETFDIVGPGGGMVILRDETGEVSEEIAALQRFDGVNGFILTSLPPFPIILRGEKDYQVGTLYNFWLPSALSTARDYSVQRVEPDGNGYVRVTMTNYDPNIFFSDSVNPAGVPVGDLDGGVKFRGLGSAGPTTTTTMQFISDGKVVNAAQAQYDDWFVPNAGGVGQFFEMKITNLILSGSLSASSFPTVDVWHDLASNLVNFSITTAIDSDGDLDCDYEIRQKTDFLNNATGIIALRAQVVT